MTESIVVRQRHEAVHHALPPHDQADHHRGDAPPGRSATPSCAVNDVSFTIEQGESVGLMGLNGSGKSTLLKLINGVMKPDAGQVLTRGRIAGLIATGAGFHPQLTGRDNVYLNAAILGMTEAETKRKFDADRRLRRHRQVPGHARSGTTPPACSRGSASRSPCTPTPTSSWSTRCSRWGTGRSRRSASRGCRRSATRAARCSTSATRPARCARCATGCWSSRRACSASTDPSTRASSTSSTTTTRTT